MDKNNKKNGLPSDIDNLRLKDHLNTSFDIDNIKVSEDLIARTLKAIGESGSQEDQPKESNKIKHTPVRRLVSAAAVILVLFIGINVLQNGLAGNKKDSQNSLDTGVAGESAAEPGSMDIYSAANDSSTSLNGSVKSDTIFDTAAADSTAADAEAPTSDGSSTNYTAEVAKDANSTEGEGTSSFTGGTLFSGLYPITFNSVVTFTVAKNDGTKITLTNVGDKVSKLYALLDGYTLTASNLKAYGNEDNWTYKAEITTSEKQTFTIMFNDNLQVSQSNEATGSSPVTYSVEDMDNLIKQVDEFYVSLK